MATKKERNKLDERICEIIEQLGVCALGSDVHNALQNELRLLTAIQLKQDEFAATTSLNLKKFELERELKQNEDARNDQDHILASNYKDREYSLDQRKADLEEQKVQQEFEMNRREEKSGKRRFVVDKIISTASNIVVPVTLGFATLIFGLTFEERGTITSKVTPFMSKVVCKMIGRD